MEGKHNVLLYDKKTLPGLNPLWQAYGNTALLYSHTPVKIVQLDLLKLKGQPRMTPGQISLPPHAPQNEDV
jgi:hypothetical protein